MVRVHCLRKYIYRTLVCFKYLKIICSNGFNREMFVVVRFLERLFKLRQRVSCILHYWILDNWKVYDWKQMELYTWNCPHNVMYVCCVVYPLFYTILCFQLCGVTLYCFIELVSNKWLDWPAQPSSTFRMNWNTEDNNQTKDPLTALKAPRNFISVQRFDLIKIFCLILLLLGCYRSRLMPMV